MQLRHNLLHTSYVTSRLRRTLSLALPIMGGMVSQNIMDLVDTNFVFRYFRVMKNVTVTLPEEAALWLRVRAAEQNRSVSSWLAEVIEGMRRQEDEYEVAMERFLTRAREPRKLEWVDGRKPTREELHDRAGLR